METPDGWGMLGLHKIIISLASYALRILPSTRMGNSGCLDGHNTAGGLIRKRMTMDPYGIPLGIRMSKRHAKPLVLRGMAKRCVVAGL